MHRNYSKQSLTAQPILDTISEANEEELNSNEQLTRLNSVENYSRRFEIQNVAEVRNLIKLTSFEVLNIKKRVNQLITDLSILNQSMNIVQESQLTIIDIIVSQEL
ncbi:Hypothetical_protein [Hexamita inflata]|uniref:Hypothetical_protein n=1 Tax=Hexamita inflata TaxID=28002 RepID=A0ABP1GGM0_9EUKA